MRAGTGVLNRRDTLRLLGGAALSAACASPALGAARRSRYQLGYGLYGMRSLPHMEALGHVARIGYREVELTLRPGWDTEPRLLTRASRAAIRRRIDDLGLTLVDVMEGMRPGSEASVEENLERLRLAAEVAHECSPGAPALVQSPIGGRPGTFMQVREAMGGELAIWASKLDELDVTFCIKPHSKQAMSHPEHVLWMVEHVKHPRMKAVYDFGHFTAFGLDMKTTIRQLAPQMGFVHIKDTAGSAPNHSFILPGDGDVNYDEYLQTMEEVGYPGPIVVEVSADVFGQPGYDPISTAQHVWDRLSPLFAA